MNNFNNGYYPTTGYQNTMGGIAPGGYMQQQPVPKLKNVLTPEEMQLIRKTAESFTLALDDKEYYRGICFHRDENGMETLRDNGDGTVTCTICDHTFDPQQHCTEEQINGYVNDIIDILQTIKLLYIDMPTEVAREYFAIIPMLEKIPKLFKIASDNFNRHENYNNYRYNGAPNTINLYNMLNSGALNPGYQPMGQPMGQQPGQPMGQPMQMNQGYGYGIQQPVQQMAPYGQPTNGFGYGAPVPTPGYRPTTTGFDYVPNQTNINNQPTGTLPQNNNVAYAPQAPLASPTAQGQQQAAPVVENASRAPTPVAATNTTATSNGKEVKVNTTFKS